MAKKEETKEVKETAKEAPKKEAPRKEAPQEAKKEKKEDKKHDGKGEEHARKDRKGAPKEGKKEAPKVKETGPEIKHIVRIADTDLDGKRSVQSALTSIKGVSRRIAKIVAVNAGIEPKTTIGYLEDAFIEKLQSSVESIPMIIPYWMMNKQNDFMTGEDKHLIGIDVLMGLNEDLNLMKKMRSYKGVRHDKGLRVRGQRTRSTGRKGRTVGVSRSALQGKSAAAKEEKKPESKGAGK
ncbi:MAG: 30S ribosomal protein S13 [Candidatus Methanoperedens sp.]|nr:30S ribosomal protein S13 [Candidatus Methanoperedens sp.]MCE8425561.1 30S ribosomal protein S13 [Candidatus Methanoperedens sp.]MCE8427481.1 30S ribosomal protein S13 [Candidatus Methanoperedens sp.]